MSAFGLVLSRPKGVSSESLLIAFLAFSILECQVFRAEAQNQTADQLRGQLPRHLRSLERPADAFG